MCLRKLLSFRLIRCYYFYFKYFKLLDLFELCLNNYFSNIENYNIRTYFYLLFSQNYLNFNNLLDTYKGEDQVKEVVNCEGVNSKF